MRRLGTRRHAAGLAVLLAVLLSACRYRAPETILLGALFPLSGASADQGEYARNGTQLAVAEINAAGGVQGKLLSVIYEDSQSAGERGLPAYQKLIQSDRVVATLAMLDDVVAPAAKLAGRLEQVLVNCSAPDVIMAAAGPTVFSMDPDNAVEARAAAVYAVQTLHLTAAATLSVERHSSVGAANAFAAEFRRLGGRILAQQQVEWNFDAVAFGENVLKPLKRLREPSPPAVFVAGPAKTTALALRTAQQMGLRAQWITGSSFELDGGIAAADAAADGVIYTAVRRWSEDSPETQRFGAAYRRRFGLEPQRVAAAAYDGVYALAAAMSPTGGRSGAELAQALRATVRSGVLGSVDFSRQAFLERPLEFRTVTAGRVRVLPGQP